MKRWLPWLAAMIPALVGFGLAPMLQSGWLSNPLFGLTADLGTVLLAAGLLASAMSLGVVALGAVARRRQQHAVDQERRQADEIHRRFIQRLDHELKNPLTAMRIGLANLSGGPPEVEWQEAVASVAAQAERLTRLTSGLRKLADLRSAPLERSTVDVEALLKEIVELGQQKLAAAERRVTFSVPQAPWPLPPAFWDRDLIFLGVHNLLDNALKFTRPGDTIEVRAAEAGADVVIEVADTGLGIPEDELPHVCEELFRGLAARGIEGSGLGLALVEAVVERHGGTMIVRSRPGRGSVFSLRLPAGSA